MPKSKSKYGTVFLGRDEATYGKDGIGTIDYDPDFECGGPKGTPGRQCSFQPTEERTQGLPLTGADGRQLHVSIASYRDPLCPKTLYNLFTKAKHPEKLQVRVLQQNDPEVDIGCFEGYCDLMAADKGDATTNTGGNEHDSSKNCPYTDQIFIHHIHASEASGPTWARGLLSKDMEAAYKKGLLKTQDHCLSIDSHMDVEPNWDHGLVEMFDQTENEYAVLSTYVTDVDALGQDRREVPHLCMVKFTGNVRTHATKSAKDLIKPKLTNAVWGAGLSFSKCHADLKVMVDPHTPHIFDGEEFNRAARFWTYGYDIYTPNRIYVLHDYHKSQSNPITTGWGKDPTLHGTYADSNKRLKTMIDVPGGETDEGKALRMKKSKFGLGDRRSLDQLIEFSGIDLRHAKITIDGKNRCGNIRWVPFKEHPKGVNYIPQFDEETEDPLDLPYDPSSVWADSSNTDDKPFNPDAFGLQKEHEALQKEIEMSHETKKKTGGIRYKEKSVGDDFSQQDFGGAKPNVQSDAKLLNVEQKLAQQVPLYKKPLSKSIHGFLENHPSIKQKQHGFQELPAPVQISVMMLIIGFFISIKMTAGKGRRLMQKIRTV